MTKPSPATARAARAQRHPLLFNQGLNEQIFWPTIVILGLAAALLIWSPSQLQPFRSHLRLVLVMCGLVLVLTFIFRLRSYVQCRAAGLYLQVPFYHLLVPYSEIKAVRPTELYRMFPPDQQTWSQRRFLSSLSADAVVVIELGQLPHSRLWLRLWMSKYMLCPDRVGLVLAVRDWIALRTEIDESRARSPAAQSEHKYS